MAFNYLSSVGKLPDGELLHNKKKSLRVERKRRVEAADWRTLKISDFGEKNKVRLECLLRQES